VNISWPSITALHAGLTFLQVGRTIADMLPQSEVLLPLGASHLKPDFPAMLKSKKQLHNSFQ